MITTMTSVARKLAQQEQGVVDELRALSAASAIAKMDPHMREDLACYMRDLTVAQKEDDGKAIEYLIDSIRELFCHSAPIEFEQATTLSQWEQKLSVAPGGEAIASPHNEMLAVFGKAYLRLKEKAGFTTQEEVAKAASLSPTTVRAVEHGASRPHFQTIKKLAKAFGVSVDELWSENK